jgi:MerR family transcriptional regulator, heat shock protein HspR
MSQPFTPRDELARQFHVTTRTLLRYEERGIVRTVSQGTVEGYEPDEVRRIWSILSYQRDLGINLAGVEAVLKLRDHLALVHARLAAVAHRLAEAIEEEQGSKTDAEPRA